MNSPYVNKAQPHLELVSALSCLRILLHFATDIGNYYSECPLSFG